MYSKVKRRKSLRRNTYSMQAHHKSISKSDQEEEEEEEGTEGQIYITVLSRVRICRKRQHRRLLQHKSLESVASRAYG